LVEKMLALPGLVAPGTTAAVPSTDGTSWPCALSAVPNAGVVPYIDWPQSCDTAMSLPAAGVHSPG